MVDVSVMSNEELSKIITEAKAELEQREYMEEDRAWSKVRKAIADYIEQYGTISVCDFYNTLYLERDRIDGSEHGVLRIFKE